MAVTLYPGSGLFPLVSHVPQQFPQFSGNMMGDTILANKIVVMGPVWFPSGSGSKDITRLGFTWAASLVKSAGSGVIISLQDIDPAASTLAPDGVQDQTVAVLNSDPGLVAGAWYRTNPLSSTRTVQCGDMLAIVLEYDAGGRTPPDYIGFRYILGGLLSSAQCGYTNFSGVIWNSPSNVGVTNVLEFTDGTYGYLAGCSLPCTSISSAVYNSGSTPDEYALEFKFKETVIIEGGSWFMTAAAGASVDLVLYQGTTVIATASVNGNNVIDNTHRIPTTALFSSAVTLTGNVVYRLAVKPTTANSITLPYLDVDNVELLTLHFGGKTWRSITRTDGGAWDTPVATRRPYIWPTIAGW